MGQLSGKVAAVTGGASGIGEATVRRFIAEGAQVSLPIVMSSVASASPQRSRLVAATSCSSKRTWSRKPQSPPSCRAPWTTLASSTFW